jgi:PTS system mannitol-specific IIC component
MGQSILARKLKDAAIDIRVDHAALSELPTNAEMVIAHRSLAPRIRELAPGARVYGVDQFISATAYEEVIRDLSEASGAR